ncbi:exopolysaccharide biosynthesis protein [Qipengyuania qiaonensis]|uniref:Exopolysaccharide biosynthesis protein n=1 Tax=Qipengyuania qiaonensis TaxID=2867240 RepID=A0ABS7JEA2_9SPHN|nr:exopolysaccharide biosynthesis protein [Qipengyuania qiaonensis]MBX7484003.1 exopolysaccharide biosynthesis protein [Qipengyuania qiaonensis]
MPHREPFSVTDVLRELDELASHGDQVRVADVLDDFGGRSFGPFIMIPALLEITPVGGIPGVPTVLALFISLIAGQLLVGRDHVWMPQVVQQRAVGSRKLHKAVRKLRGLASFLDRYSEGRLEGLTEGPVIRLVALIVIALCCTVPPLEFLPFASSIPMLAIAVLGMALTVRDGALVLGSLVFTGIATALGIYVYLNATNDGSGLSLI